MSKKKSYPKVETGYFESGLPYTKIGDKPSIYVELEGLTYKNEPASGIPLKQSIKSHKILAKEFTIYIVGRKPNLPEDYTFDNIAEDYGNMIRNEFKKPVIVAGLSTGGQIAQYLAANHPDTIEKLIIISAAYKLSNEGKKIEGKSAEYFKQGKYGKSLANMISLIYSSGFKSVLMKIFVRLIGKLFIGKIEYPNDCLVEFKGDIEMDFKDRLKEIKAPTLLLSGEDDIDYAAVDVKLMGDIIPNAEVILYKDYGHSLYMANANQIQIDVLEFLQK